MDSLRKLFVYKVYAEILVEKTAASVLAPVAAEFRGFTGSSLLDYTTLTPGVSLKTKSFR
jgi:hypothetical protein